MDSSHEATGTVARAVAGGPTNAPKPEGDTLPGLNHGFSQSPIDIDTRHTATEASHAITLHFEDAVNKVENLGHTVQLDFEKGSTISFDGTTFEFVQAHFHTPSEHHLDGRAFPLEMHIVNVEPGRPEADPHYLVIGVLFEDGARSAFLDDFLDAIPQRPHEAAELEPGQVSFADLFDESPAELIHHYYRYDGSLTTPPYTESVRWFIAKHVYQASTDQMETLASVEGHNARHVQGLYGRSVTTM